MDPALAPGTPPRTIVFQDGLGERRRISDVSGAETIEQLCLRSELTAIPSFEFALRERASRLAAFRHVYFGRVRSVDRLNDTASTLAVVSDSIKGVRLANLLAANERRPMTLDITASVHLIRQLVVAVAMLHDNARDVAHGAIGPERIIVTPNARVVIVEYVLGAALEQLHYSVERYWKDLRVALPLVPGLPRFDHRADVTQIGVVSLSLVLGRLLHEDEYPSRVGEVLASAWAISSKGELEPLPQGLRTWIARALQLDPRRSFSSALEARDELDRVLSGEDTREPNPEPVATAPDPGFRFDPLPPELTPAGPKPEPPAARPEPVPAKPQSAAVRPELSLTDLDTPLTPEPFKREPSAVNTDAFAVRTDAPAVRTDASAVRTDAPAVKPEPPAFSSRPEVSFAQADAFPLPVPAHRTDESPESGSDEEPRSRSWGRMAAAVAAIVILAAGGYAARKYIIPGSPASRTGTLNINSNPPGAQVIVDGQASGVTPLTLNLKAGSHDVELRGPGGDPRTIPVTITAGTQVSQYIELPKITAFGQLQVRSEPPGAQVTVDGLARGKAPVLVEALAAGEHSVVLDADGTNVKQTVSVEAGMTASLVVPLTAADNAPVSGWVTITAPVELQIFENHRLLGTSQTDRLMVGAGRHEIELVNDTLGFRQVRSIQVAAGRVAPIKVEWPKGSIAINALPWAEVWIDGERVGETPIGNLALPIGPHEILFRHPDLGEQHFATTVTLKAPARVSVDLRKK